MDRRQLEVSTQLSPIIPYEILDDKCRYAARLYGQILKLASESGGNSLTLPDRVTMAKRCDCSLHSLTDAYSSLEKLGYLVIHNKVSNGPTRRKYATVKTIDRIMVDTITTHQATVEMPDEREKFTQFPRHLKAAKLVCVNKDRTGRTLNSVDDKTLWELSGGASFDDIYLAVREVESYRPKDAKPIENIFNVFLARFQFDRSGQGKLKADRARKKKYASDDTPQADPFASRAKELGASIFPDNYHDKKTVDRFCDVLNSRGAVERGEAPKSIRDKWLSSDNVIISHRDEPDQKLVLADTCELVKLEHGYWAARPVVALVIGPGRRSGTTHSLADGLSSILSNLPDLQTS